MGIFNRKKEDGSPADPAQAKAAPAGAAPAAAPPPASATRDPDIGVPPFRPATKDNSMMNSAPKPSAAPAVPSVSGPRPAPIATAPARPVGRIEPSERRTLVVGRGISLQGTVADAERLVVEGTVESQMIHAAELFVAGSGVFKGEVEVEDAEIAGAFDGTITARGSLIIRTTGKISGTARCRKLSVEEGGQVSGKMEMLTEAAALVSPARIPTQSVPADA
ncbi:MAG: polymer-forming cytoskeletal protein [Acetobacteraceae bacterium]|nr:polymer-forming cytoskeletal protein [Acetobacteraceae bacterium]